MRGQDGRWWVKCGARNCGCPAVGWLSLGGQCGKGKKGKRKGVVFGARRWTEACIGLGDLDAGAEGVGGDWAAGRQRFRACSATGCPSAPCFSPRFCLLLFNVHNYWCGMPARRECTFCARHILFCLCQTRLTSKGSVGSGYTTS